jgi:fluoroacetyl-CoA thioesterase
MPPSLPKIYQMDYVVTDQEAIHFMGADVPPVLSTPSLVNMMELASRENVRSLLDAGEDTVGVLVNIKHLAATPVGMKVRVVSKLVRVEGRIYTCDVEAFDEFDKIAEGTHERASVFVAKFAGRVSAKKAKAGNAG